MSSWARQIYDNTKPLTIASISLLTLSGTAQEITYASATRAVEIQVPIGNATLYWGLNATMNPKFEYLEGDEKKWTVDVNTSSLFVSGTATETIKIAYYT